MGQNYSVFVMLYVYKVKDYVGCEWRSVNILTRQYALMYKILYNMNLPAKAKIHLNVFTFRLEKPWLIAYQQKFNPFMRVDSSA